MSEIIKSLQAVVSGLAQAADGHAIQSRIFAAQGFKKLAEKYAGHSEEERGYMLKCVDRIIELGGEVKNEAKNETLITRDALEFIKWDLQTSRDGLSQLAVLIDGAKDDFTSYDILKAHYQDEEKDMYWAEQQLELVKIIGIENWYASQM